MARQDRLPGHGDPNFAANGDSKFAGRRALLRGGLAVGGAVVLGQAETLARLTKLGLASVGDFGIRRAEAQAADFRAPDFETFVNLRGGIPEFTTNVEQADGVTFLNETRQGTEAMWAGKGGLWLEEFTEAEGARTRGAAVSLGAHIHRFEEDSEDGFTNGRVLIPEGGWMYGSAQEFTFWATLPDGRMIDIVFPEIQDNTTQLYVRGLYPDGRKSDRNVRARIMHVASASNLFLDHPALRDGNNVAFMSEGWALQQVNTAHNGGTNFGDSGSEGLTIAYLDLNTLAFGAWRHDRQTGQFRTIFRNYEPRLSK